MIRDSGVARLMQPPAYGGAGGPLRDIVGVVSDVGAACGSTGWAVVQYVVHPFMVAQWPREAQDEVWGDDPKNLVAGILIQSLGRYERVDGGYRVSGRWPFVTGVDTCDWCIVSGYEQGRAGQHESHLHFLIERGEIEILDTWDALGLRGSGTNDVRLQEFFVPAHRALSMEALRGGESPGGHWRETPFYLLPSYPIFGCGISSGAVGIALEMVAEYNEIARRKGSIMAEKGVATFASQHIRFAEAKAAVDCARQLLRLRRRRDRRHRLRGGPRADPGGACPLPRARDLCRKHRHGRLPRHLGPLRRRQRLQQQLPRQPLHRHDGREPALHPEQGRELHDLRAHALRARHRQPDPVTTARWFDDIAAGERFVTGAATLSEAEIVAFAQRFDPQPIHVDAAYAATGPYDGLIASGFQTMALGFRLFYELGVLGEACIGGPGIDTVRFHRPARPGDSIHAVATVAETRPSRSKPDRGYVRMAYEVRNQRGEAVLSFEIVHILMRRPPEATGAS